MEKNLHKTDLPLSKMFRFNNTMTTERNLYITLLNQDTRKMVDLIHVISSPSNDHRDPTTTTE